MVKMIFHGKTIHFYTITDMCQHFNKSRPYIKQELDDIKQEYGEEMFSHHSCYAKLEANLKRPALYVSEDIYQLIQQKVQLNHLKKKLINLLPDNIYDLKQIIIRQQLFFINQLNAKPKPLYYREDLDALKKSMNLNEK